MSKLQLPAFPNTAYRNTKPQFKMQQSSQWSRSALYGRLYSYLQAEVHCMELTFFMQVFSFLMCEHVLKMNVVLTKECTHLFSNSVPDQLF